MKVAIVHDYIKEHGGAERVLEELHQVFPDAPIFTTVYLPEFLGPHKERFKDFKIKSSYLQMLPFKAKLISPMRLFSRSAFGSFDFSGFDAIIVSQTGAFIPNLIKKGNAVQICYCHTPPRYLYGYATARQWKKNPLMRVIGEVANHFLRMSDYQASENVDYYISNSENVKRRIKKFYRKDARVIYPPVEIKKIDGKTKKEDFYLTGGRLARPKHVDLIVETFTKLNLPLKVFGKAFAGYGEELRQIAGKNVEFLGEVSDEEKLALMRKAKAFIFASEDEDFGITPVEAIASTTPVIAYKSGGVLETIVEGKTGFFFEELTADSLTKALKKLVNFKIDEDEFKKHANKYSKERFRKEIKEFVNKVAK